MLGNVSPFGDFLMLICCFKIGCSVARLYVSGKLNFHVYTKAGFGSSDLNQEKLVRGVVRRDSNGVIVLRY